MFLDRKRTRRPQWVESGRLPGWRVTLNLGDEVTTILDSGVSCRISKLGWRLSATYPGADRGSASKAWFRCCDWHRLWRGRKRRSQSAKSALQNHSCLQRRAYTRHCHWGCSRLWVWCPMSRDDSASTTECRERWLWRRRIQRPFARVDFHRPVDA